MDSFKKSGESFNQASSDIGYTSMIPADRRIDAVMYLDDERGAIKPFNLANSSPSPAAGAAKGINISELLNESSAGGIGIGGGVTSVSASASGSDSFIVMGQFRTFLHGESRDKPASQREISSYKKRQRITSQSTDSNAIAAVTATAAAANGSSQKVDFRQPNFDFYFRDDQQNKSQVQHRPTATARSSNSPSNNNNNAQYHSTRLAQQQQQHPLSQQQLYPLRPQQQQSNHFNRQDFINSTRDRSGQSNMNAGGTATGRFASEKTQQNSVHFTQQRNQQQQQQQQYKSEIPLNSHHNQVIQKQLQQLSDNPTHSGFGTAFFTKNTELLFHDKSDKRAKDYELNAKQQRQNLIQNYQQENVKEGELQQQLQSRVVGGSPQVKRKKYAPAISYFFGFTNQRSRSNSKKQVNREHYLTEDSKQVIRSMKSKSQHNDQQQQQYQKQIIVGMNMSSHQQYEQIVDNSAESDSRHCRTRSEDNKFVLKDLRGVSNGQQVPGKQFHPSHGFERPFGSECDQFQENSKLNSSMFCFRNENKNQQQQHDVFEYNALKGWGNSESKQQNQNIQQQQKMPGQIQQKHSRSPHDSVLKRSQVVNNNIEQVKNYYQNARGILQQRSQNVQNQQVDENEQLRQKLSEQEREIEQLRAIVAEGERARIQRERMSLLAIENLEREIKLLQSAQAQTLTITEETRQINRTDCSPDKCLSEIEEQIEEQTQQVQHVSQQQQQQQNWKGVLEMNEIVQTSEGNRRINNGESQENYEDKEEKDLDADFLVSSYQQSQQQQHNCGSGMKFSAEQRFRFRLTELLRVENDEDILTKLENLLSYRKSNESFSNQILLTLKSLAPIGAFKDGQEPTLLHAWKFIKASLYEHVSLIREKNRLEELAKQLTDIIENELNVKSQ